MIDNDLRYLIKIQELRARGFNVIENVPFEVIEDESSNETNNNSIVSKE